MAEVLTPKQQSAIERARSNPDLRRILYRKATGLKWYDAFVGAGFIVPSEIPKPIPAKEEGFVSIPHWLITDYLVEASPELSNPENRDYAVKFLDFMRSTTAYARDNASSNYRVWWQFSKIVRHIPVDLLTEHDIQNFSYWLDDPYERGIVAESLGRDWLSAVLDLSNPRAIDIANKFLSVLYRVSIRERGSGDLARKEVFFSFDSWHGKKITKAIAAKSGRILGVTAVDIFRGRLEEMISGLDNDRWSTIWRPAIEDHEQNRSANDTDDILIEAFRDCLLAYVQREPGNAMLYISALLDSPYLLIRRIAIHAIDSEFVSLGVLAGAVLEARYFDSHFHHELWHLLNRRYPGFSQENKDRTLNTIESLVRVDENNNEHPSASAYKRAKWLAAIREHEPRLMDFYRNYVQAAGSEPDHPDFSSYMSTGWAGPQSPIPFEKLRAMDVFELVRQLEVYRDPGKFLEPGLEGLTKALRQVVKSEPMRYYKELALFSRLDLAYIYSIIEAYSELWGEKAQLIWQEIWPRLLAFCEELIQQPRFWAYESAQERPHFVANRYWIVGGIARLIETGTRSDEHAFSKDLLPQAERILNVLLDCEKGAEFKIDSDAVSIAINSPRGRALEAFINLTLRACRLAESDSQRAVVWGHFKQRYEMELARGSSGEYEFATLIVNYLPNFLYMSRDWVLRNLDVIFDEGNEQRWLCAMQAYAYVNTVYPEIYKHLRDSGHFIRALNDPRLKDRVDEKIVQNIVIAYLMGIEVLTDEGGLLRCLLQRRNLAELSQLVWFFWTMRKGDGDEDLRKKIFELWPQLLAAVDTNTREGRRLASRLCYWTAFVKEVDQITKPLILSVAPFAEEDYNSSELLESIARISDRQPHEAYEIWMCMLETSQPDYPIESVKQALTNIVRIGDDGIRKAKAVVSKYIAGGHDSVQLVWNELMSELQRH